jgi:hypothetical protein
MNPKLKSQAVALANKVHIATGSGAFPEEKNNVWRKTPHVFRFIPLVTGKVQEKIKSMMNSRSKTTRKPEFFVSETTRESSQGERKSILQIFKKMESYHLPYSPRSTQLVLPLAFPRNPVRKNDRRHGPRGPWRRLRHWKIPHLLWYPLVI